MKQYVAYYRVSTAKQGASGLGLEAQQYAVASFLKGGKIAGEYIEVESGKKNNRPQLLAAIEHTRKTKATLVIAKLDRLSRNAAFIFTLKDSGVDFICADMPDANTLTIGIFAVMAQHEREMISSRTKAALRQIKHKIETEGWTVSKNGNVINKLGKPVNLTYEHRLAGGLAVKQKAAENQNNKRAAAMVQLYRAQGLNWLAIAGKLNEAGFRASKGGAFQAVQVQRIYQRIAAN
ncbi:recombinase family protein [Adhaeribacter rhizoryzae]|uniref:Recombinase family protein n=1 Tax=Adhaeribacter rhizoryzae TaxID=2607907 RepID=A0A5M6CVH2_9BACT|nr:recombinase family protein [Adhaeribacter rhizoryzae]KAA5539043.1 recombinase family protein [Adhaeribacter rhizoryzae]